MVDHWWLVGSALLVAVVVLACVLYVGDSDRRQQRQHAAQQQAVTVLSQSVDDVLAREIALARVVGTLSGPIAGRWPALSNIVMSQSLANSASFIQPVSERDRTTFERRTGLRLVESPKPGVLRIAGRRSQHLVLTEYRQVGPGPPPLGLDIGADTLRRNLLLRAARTGRQLATPPVEFLGREQQVRGVAVYAAVRDRRGRLTGWVAAAYKAQQLASMVTAAMPGVHVTIHDGASILVAGPAVSTGRAAVVAVAGRRWSVWAEVPQSGISAVPWLVLGLGLALAAAVMLIMRQAAIGARQSTQQLALRDAEQAALGQIATLVAHGESPDVVFRAVAEQVAKLLNSRTGAVSHFDAASNRGTVLGGWTRDGQDLAGTVFALDGVTASAEVFRTGWAARTDSGYGSTTGPIATTMTILGGSDGVAAPITVAGNLWGALGAAYSDESVPAGIEPRLERFASLVGLAISNADAWDRLANQASSDSLTGIANRRAPHERLGAEVARAHRYGRHLSLVLLDIDHFKAVNDLRGHQAGDRVLVLFAQLLSAHSRAAERMRSAIETMTFEDGGRVTVSAGVCSTENARDADSLVRDADRALYWAKDSGRNMTFLYTDEARAAFSNDEPPNQITEPVP